MQSTALPPAGDPSRTSRRTRVLLLSIVQPENTSAGQIVLYRHLVASGDFELLACTPELPSLLESKAWRRIKNTRLFRLTNTIEELFISNNPSARVTEIAEAFAPDVVMTVAHGRGYAQAHGLANQLGVPLLTIFHDWWPDLDDILPGCTWVSERRFLRIARQSAVCLCVSEQMKNALASSGNTIVLPPIPDPTPHPPRSKPVNSQFKIGYFGNLYDYGPMLADLAEATLERSDIKLEIRSGNPNWPTHRIEKYIDANILLPFAPREEFADWIGGLDATLCTMSFDPRLRRRMETSFPSKLLESLQFGIPAIIWGPQYCAAIQWARDRKTCLCVTTPSVDSAIQQMAEFAADPVLRRASAASFQRLAQTEFSPRAIHEKFVAAIRTSLASRCANLMSPKI